MNVKKIIAIILSVFMVASLAGCAGTSVPSSADSDGIFVYTVVRSGEKVIPAIESAARELRLSMKENFGCQISIIKDVALEDFDGNYEILIGDTNREESAEAKQKLIDNRSNNKNDFIVAVMDDKIVIQTTNDAVMEPAVQWFVKTFCQDMESWAKLKKGYEFIYEHNNVDVEGSNTVSGVDLGTFTAVLPVKTSYMVGMGAEEFETYYTKFGYQVKTTEDIDEEDTYEVLFGDCNREASKSVKVEGDNYVIRVVGTKVVIKGGNDLATNRGIKAFLDEIKKIESGNGFSWSDGYTVNGKYDANEKGAYTLNWNDEFDTNVIDLTKWSDYRNKSHETSESCLGGTRYEVDVYGETSYKGNNYTDLIYQSNGTMHLGTQFINGKDFISGQISTYWTMTFRYGVMEIYAKHAPSPANCGYWANGASTETAEFVERFGTRQTRSCMTEIDILENFGSNVDFHSNVHRWWSNRDVDGTSHGSAHNSLDGSAIYSGNSLNNKKKVYDTKRYGNDLSDDFHYYGVYWDDNCMKFYFDGKVYLDYQYEDNMSVGVHCLMNYFNTECHMGSASYGLNYDPDIHKPYYETEIDFIRVYQTDTVNCQMITAWPEKQANGTSKIFYPDHDINSAY